MISGDRKKKSKRKKGGSRLVFWLSTVALLAALFSAWQLWFYIHSLSPRLNALLINVNGETRKLLPGETVAFHPKDRVKILRVSTNIPLNYEVRLLSENFDVNALRYDTLRLSSLLPNHEAFNQYRFRIQVKHRNATIGGFEWEVRPFVEDWLEKADRTIDVEKRLSLLERAVALDPSEERLKKRLIDEYKSHDRWKEAAALLEKSEGKEANPDALKELIDVYAAMGAKEKLASAIGRLLVLEPDDLKMRLRLAEILEQEGEPARAAKEYEVYLSRMGEGDKLPLYKKLGYLYTQSKHYEKAIDFYLSAAKLDQGDANLYYNLSYLYERINQKEKADFYLQNAVTLKSDDTESRFRLAQGFFDKGEMDRAAGYLKEILEKRPQSLRALHLLMQIYEKGGDSDRLKDTYKKILALDPKNETILYNLGALEYETGNPEGSLPYFKAYLSAHPDDAAVRGILFDVYKKQGNDQEAYKEAAKLMELTPEEMGPYRFAFGCLQKQENYDAIIQVMEKGLQANPQSVELREYLIVGYLKRGKEEQAAKQMEEVLKSRPDDSNLLFDLAQLREKQGKYADALDAYKRVIDLSPGREDAQEAYLRLRLKGVGRDGGK